jgi:hypothetical protein
MEKLKKSKVKRSLKEIEECGAAEYRSGGKGIEGWQ